MEEKEPELDFETQKRIARVNTVEDGVAIGSGYTTRSLMGELHQVKTAAFKVQLTGMIRSKDGRGGFTKKQVDDMIAGFEDGFRNALLALEEMGVIRVDKTK